MLGSVFYHNIIRKYTNAFGTLFNDITVQRKSDDGSTVLQSIMVPIQYGSKGKYVQMLTRPQETTNVMLQLPRMAFLMTGMEWDPDRAVNPINKNVHSLQNPRIGSTQFAQLPYKLNYEVNILARNYDDASQIVEQIIPFFTPTFSQNIQLIPEMDLNFDMVVKMTNMNIEDSFENDISDVRTVTWTLYFEVFAWFFGPTNKANIIKRIQTDFTVIPGSGGIESVPNYNLYGRNERLVTMPGLTANNEPTTSANTSIPYYEINADDPYGFIEEHYAFDDGKKYDPKTGTDKETKIPPSNYVNGSYYDNVINYGRYMNPVSSNEEGQYDLL